MTYNDSLLSLYGMSKNKNILSVFKSFLYFFVCFFGIIVFFIIYNSYSISIGVRRKEVILYKLASANENFLYRLYFFLQINNTNIYESYLAYFQYTSIKRKEKYKQQNPSSNWVLTNIQT